MSPRLAFAIDVAQEAGRGTLPLFRSTRDFDVKEDLSPVTKADRNAEHTIRQRIAERWPGERVLGEEEGGDTDWPDRWVVDPIDGTKSYVAGVPLYATLLAYEVDQAPILGVAYFPALDETVFAELGGGCHWNGKPCRVTEQGDVSRSVLCLGGLNRLASAGALAGVLRLAAECLAARTWCDAYGHALVATGRAAAMIDPFVSRWDVSAMSVIVREAGGSFTDFRGVETLGSEALSCSPSIRARVLEALSA